MAIKTYKYVKTIWQSQFKLQVAFPKLTDTSIRNCCSTAWLLLCYFSYKHKPTPHIQLCSFPRIPTTDTLVSEHVVHFNK